MTRRLHVEPDAEDELAEAVAWYDERGEGIGDRLIGEVMDAMARITQNPGAFALAPHVDPALGVKRALCDRFPYAVTFIEQEEGL
jgi:hypothetical protein